MLGDTVLVLTEPSNKLLSVQLPGASSIQPIKEELQLLCAAWEIILLQLLRIKEIRKKKKNIQSSGSQWSHPLPACLSE